MFCAKCGSILVTNAKFCSKCGEIVRVTTEQISPSPIEQPDLNTHTANSFASFQDSTRLTRWLIYFLYASIILGVIGSVSGLFQYRLLCDFKLGIYSSEALAVAAAEANDKRQQMIAVLQTAIAIITIIIFSTWIYRANSNARKLGAQRMRFSAAWAVGYYFIPILWFWKPYQAMREIWQASREPSAWESVRRGSILPWWWFLFLTSAILGNISFRLTMGAAGIDELLVSSGVTIASDIVNILATFIALFLVRQIYDMQMAQVLERDPT